MSVLNSWCFTHRSSQAMAEEKVVLLTIFRYRKGMWGRGETRSQTAGYSWPDSIDYSHQTRYKLRLHWLGRGTSHKIWLQVNTFIFRDLEKCSLLMPYGKALKSISQEFVNGLSVYTFFLWDLQREAFYLKAYLSGLKCKSVHVMQFKFSGQGKTELKLDRWYNNSKVKRKWGNIRLFFESLCYRLMITSNSPPPMTDNDPKFFSLKYVYDSLHAVSKSSQ